MNGMKMTVSVVLLAAGAGLVGCASTGANKAPQGALIGSLLGAGLGAVIGHQSGETAAGAVIGAAAGGAGGYVLGNEQDKAQMQTQAALDKAELQAQASAANQAANTVVVNVTNSNGSITPVTLQRVGNEYIGPKGEHYLAVPTPEQLRQVYGF